MANRKRGSRARRRIGYKSRGTYCRIGHRLAELGSQRKLAKALGVTQQTTSKKLRGETAIMLSDLERISRKYKKPMTWFFEGYRSGDYPSDMVGSGR